MDKVESQARLNIACMLPLGIDNISITIPPPIETRSLAASYK